MLYQLSYVGSDFPRGVGAPWVVGSGGFEPPKLAHLVYSQAQLSTLATARAGDDPARLGGADDGTRTRNRLFTKQLLCQLSYVGQRT